MDIKKLLEFLFGQGALNKAQQTGATPPFVQPQNPVPNYVQQEIARRLGGSQGGMQMPPGPSQPIPQGLQGNDAQSRLQQILKLLGGA